MRPQLDAPLINPQRKRYRIPGLTLPKEVDPSGFLLLLATAYFGAMLFHLLHGYANPGLLVTALILNVMFASMIGIHAARCRASSYTIEREKEIREASTIIAPVVSLVYTIAYIECYRLDYPSNWIVVGIGVVALCIRRHEVIEGYVHWLGYDNTRIPGTLNHIGGFQLVRHAMLFAMVMSFALGGKLPFTLPVCTVAVALLCVVPGKHGRLGRYEALAVRLKKSLPGVLPLGWLLDNAPLFFRVRFNLGHVEVYGSNRSGKSSLVLAPMIETIGDISECSGIIIDMKGHEHDLYGAAVATGKKVVVITNVLDEHTSVFNLFKQDFWRRLNDAAKAGLICQALNLDHGDEYGQNWFKEAILYVSTVSQIGFDFENWGQFAASAQAIINDRRLNSEIRNAANHIFLNASRLAHEPLLNAADTFQLTDVFREDIILLAHLTIIHGRGTPADIGRLIMNVAPAAHEFVKRELSRTGGKRPRQLLLVADEYQLMAAKNTQWLLQTMASRNFMIVISCQCPADLSQRDSNLEGTIHKNASIRIDFSLTSDEELRELKTTGGTVVDYVQGTKSEHKIKYSKSYYYINKNRMSVKKSNYSFVTENNYTEILGDRIDANTALLVSQTPMMAFVRLNKSDDLNDYGGQILIVEFAHHISEAEYRRRCNLPFPQNEHTILNGGDESGPDDGTNRPVPPRPKTLPTRPVERVDKPKKKKRY